VPVTGSFRDPQGATMDFQITRQPGDLVIWDQWRSTTPGGFSGTYRLGDQFTGYGEVLQGGEALGPLSWTGEGLATFTRTGGGELTGRPSAAALDFIVDQWIHKLGEFGPSPR